MKEQEVVYGSVRDAGPSRLSSFEPGRMLELCVDVLFLQPHRNRGTDSYTFELLSELEAVENIHLTLVANRGIAERFSEFRRAALVVAPISGRNRVARVVYQQLCLQRVARRLGAQVVFCPGYLSPIATDLPTVVTIHDTQFRDVPASISWGQRFIYNRIIPTAARRARKVLTVSSFSRDRIHQELGVPLEKIAVIHTGPKRPRDKVRSGEDAAKWRQLRGLSGPYVLSVSSGLSHKNARRLIEAFRLMQSQHGTQHQLVLAGQSSSELARLKIQDGNGVVALGYVSDSDLHTLYANADGFILASLYEGFGMPVLEAMQHGLPVACSTAASLPEIAGQGALLFEGTKVEEIRRALQAILTDSALRKSLIAAGYANLNRFSWKKCAAETFHELHKASQSGSQRSPA